MNKIKEPILWKLILIIGIPLFIVYSIILIVNYSWSKTSSLEQMKHYLIEHSGHNASVLNSELTQFAESPRIIAELLSIRKLPSEKELYAMISEIIQNNSSIYGMTVAFEPNTYNKKRELFAPYIYKDNKKQIRLNLAENNNYLNSDWYLIPKLLDKPNWSEPYYDEVGAKILMCTYSVPIHKNGKFIGIVTADFSLKKLQEKMRNVKILAGYTFIISRYGTYIYHPNEKDIMRETIFSKAEMHNFPMMRKFARKMISGKSGVETFADPISNSNKWLVYSPIESCKWSFAAIVPEKEILSKVNLMIINQSALMIIGLAIIILIIIWASYKITQPIRELTGLAERLATGDLTVKMGSIKGHGEIHELAEVFNKMVIDLKQHIFDLTKATKEKASVDSELRIARNIQESLLPRIFPPFPERHEFDLYAKYIPAKEVAGDFYDFFFLDQDKFAFLIADVSGKGIAASLFMAVAKTMIKAKSDVNKSPDKILFEVNNDLCVDNESAMFVTTFLAILDMSSGKVIYSNGGHNLPYLIKNNGNISQIENTDGIALGVMDDADFHTNEIYLQKNDVLYLYTDGINEAMDKNDNEFSYQRLENILSNTKNANSKEITERTIDAVKKFTIDAEQSDDITVLVVKYLI
ncbi:MAG: SpoIIE family protein phosphatase [Candidatus Cloacimonetes bacterium]|nr:SpoIIE family protein phosphatase [Candidatus Cloacimonadota bacterium]